MDTETKSRAGSRGPGATKSQVGEVLQREGWQIREEESIHHTLFETELAILNWTNTGPSRTEVLVKCRSMETRRNTRDPEGSPWDLTWLANEFSAEQRADQGELRVREQLRRLDE